MTENKDIETSLKELELYKKINDEELSRLKQTNLNLEYKLSITSNLLDINKHLNSGIGNQDIFNVINDVAIAIFGVSYSTIIIKENEDTYLNISNIETNNYKNFNFMKKFFGQETFLISCSDNILIESIKEPDTKSLLGYPIFCKKEFVGYMILEHHYKNFFDHHKVHFLGSLADLLAMSYENFLLYRQLDEKSKIDSMLSIFTRGEFIKKLEEKLKLNKTDFALVMLDIDNFKSINDSHGHLFGDSALMQTTEIIKNLIDENDFMGRYGGEEFIIYIDNFSDQKNLLTKIEKIRRSIEKNTIEFNGSKSSVTTSFGIAIFPYDGKTIDELLNTADSLLYTAKNNGKNKIEINS